MSDALENYAANYYETGGTELDLSGAVQILREKRKKTDRFIREEADKEERKIQKMLQECEYLEQDMDEIQREYEERKQEKIKKRVTELTGAGLVFNGEFYVINEISMDIVTIEKMSEADYDFLLAKVKIEKKKNDEAKPKPKQTKKRKKKNRQN